VRNRNASGASQTRNVLELSGYPVQKSMEACTHTDAWRPQFKG
jgi:hypothetical protein